MFFRAIIYFILFCGFSLLTVAQVTVRGNVCDDNGEALVGANVMLREVPGKGTVTDEDGNYLLSVKEKREVYTIEVSYIGYMTQHRRLRKKENREDFVMKEEGMNLETVVVTGTRTPKLLKEAPIITRVITSEDISRVNATHIGQLLETELPGIEFSYSMDQQVSLNLQGFGGNSILFLVDGERLAGETLDNIDYNRLNLDNVERIEIVKGAASSLYGSNAVGGVVNIISKEVRKPWTVNLNGRYNTNNEQVYGGSVGFKLKDFSSQTHVQYAFSDSLSLKNDGDYSVIYGGYNWNFKENITYQPIERLKLTARAGYFFRQRDSKPDIKDRYRDFSGGLKGVYDIKDNQNVEIAYGFDQYDKSNYILIGENDVREYSNVQHSVRTVYSLNIGKNNIIVGGDYLRDYLMTYQFEDGSKMQHTADAFAQFDWNPSKSFNIINGIRFDYFSDRKLFHVSPKLGLMYKINNCSLRGAYAGGFRAPTIKEMYMSFDMANIFMIYGNPDLKPEQSHNLSVSAEYTKSRYNVTLTGFYNLVDNRITTVWNAARKGMVYTNMAQLKVSGVDANVSARYPCGLSARVSYTFTHEKIRKGEPLTTQTRPHSATIKLDYGKDWKNYGFNAMITGRVLSKVDTDVYTSLTNYEETVRQTYPGYTIWKLNISQRIWKGINLNLAVDNLFNYVPDYYYSNSPSTVGTSFTMEFSVDMDRMFGK